MVRIGSLLMTLVGLGVAVGSVYGAQKILNAPSAGFSVSADQTVAQVVVAREEIPFGAAIESHKITTITWPKDALPPGAFTNTADLLPVDINEPRRAKRPMAQGEILLASKVSDFGEKVTIVQTLGKNMRAVTINVNAATGVGGFVTPGDRVDILLTSGGRGDMKTVTLLQNIRIVGTDQNANEDESNPSVVRTVTVEVSPDDGQKLVLGQSAGTLSLTLRNSENTADKPLEQVRLVDLLREKSPLPEEPRRETIRINRRGATSEVELR